MKDEAKRLVEEATSGGGYLCEQSQPARLRPFTKTDWYGFAGADKLPDGREPFIGEIDVDTSEWPPEDLEELGRNIGGEKPFATIIVSGDRFADKPVSVQFISPGGGFFFKEFTDPNDAVADATAFLGELLSTSALRHSGYQPANFSDRDMRFLTGKPRGRKRAPGQGVRNPYPHH